MEKATRVKLAKIAKDMAQVPFHGDVDGMAANLAPIVQLFPTWNLKEADGLWCAAFVYYCCVAAGFEIPYRPGECKTCHLAACLGWEEFAAGDRRIEYHKGLEGYVPEAGDIVLYDRVFENKEHDHIGIVLEKRECTILVAEGNVNNISEIIERSVDEHIRAYIRIPDGYRYRNEQMIVIDKLTESEIPFVAPLVAQFRVTLKSFRGIAAVPDEAGGAAELKEYLDAGFPVYTARADGTYCGYIVCRVDEPCVWVESVYVHPDFRRQGIGAALFGKAEELAASFGEDTVYNYVHPNNHAMIAFLREKGYFVLNLLEIRKPYAGEQLTRKTRVDEEQFDY